MWVILFLPVAAHGQAYGYSSCGRGSYGMVWGQSTTYMPYGALYLGVEAWLLDPMWMPVNHVWADAPGDSVTANTSGLATKYGSYSVTADHYKSDWGDVWDYVASSSCNIPAPDPPSGEDVTFSGWDTSGGLFAYSYATLSPSSSFDYEGLTISDRVEFLRDTCHEAYPTGPRVTDPGTGVWTVANGSYGPDLIGSLSEWLDVYAPLVAAGTIQSCGWTFRQDMYYDRGSGPEFFTSHTIGQSLQGTTATSTRGGASASHSAQ